MKPFSVINGKWIGRSLLFCIFLFSAFIWYSFQAKIISATESSDEEIRKIHMVTGEFTATTAEGKEIEVYRFDPGTIFLKKGEKVLLKIFGVNGTEHPFIIEGTDIQGTVEKGKETVIPLQFENEGTYRLVCISHLDYSKNGPMIAYIVVN
jgi:plastocyanin